jgi:hypothetical protein
MKITNTQIKQIIKEELEKVLNETSSMSLSYEDEMDQMSQPSKKSSLEDEIYDIDKASQENHDAGQVQHLLDKGFTMQQIQILDALDIIDVEKGGNKDFNIRTWTK